MAPVTMGRRVVRGWGQRLRLGKLWFLVVLVAEAGNIGVCAGAGNVIAEQQVALNSKCVEITDSSPHVSRQIRPFFRSGRCFRPDNYVGTANTLFLDKQFSSAIPVEIRLGELGSIRPIVIDNLVLDGASQHRRHDGDGHVGQDRVGGRLAPVPERDPNAQGMLVVSHDPADACDENVCPELANLGVPGDGELLARDPGLPASEGGGERSGYQREGEDKEGSLLVGAGAFLAAFALIWRGLDHGLIRIREGRYLYNYVVGLALVLAGIAAVLIGVWALFPLTDGLAAQAATG